MKSRRNHGDSWVRDRAPSRISLLYWLLVMAWLLPAFASDRGGGGETDRRTGALDQSAGVRALDPGVFRTVAEEKTYRIQRDKIYYGDPDDFTAPAVLDASRVYNQIPAYRKIVEKDLNKDDPEYWPLMRRASTTFVKALRGVCAKESHDLVGEIGSIAPEDEEDSVPDITDDVIGAVKGERLGDELPEPLDLIDSSPPPAVTE